MHTYVRMASCFIFETSWDCQGTCVSCMSYAAVIGVIVVSSGMLCNSFRMADVYPVVDHCPVSPGRCNSFGSECGGIAVHLSLHVHASLHSCTTCWLCVQIIMMYGRCWCCFSLQQCIRCGRDMSCCFLRQNAVHRLLRDETCIRCWQC